jgi:hypothetical protein
MRPTKMLAACILSGSILLSIGGQVAGAQGPRQVAVVPVVASTGPCGTKTTPGTYKHVIVIFMENNSNTTIKGSKSAPYINSLIAKCGYASNYHNVTHPSLPNYIASTDGATLSALAPFESDCTPSPSCESTTNNIFNEVTGKKGWKGYAESMPSNCYQSDSGFYAPRHNPAVYYTDLSTCSSRDVPLGTTSSSPLLSDFSTETKAPSFAWITPNLCDDMHGASGCPSNLVKTGDTWLGRWVPLITGTNVYKDGDTALFITWDEGEGGSYKTGVSCHVLFIAVAPSVMAGTVDSSQLNHYSLLKTTEDLLGVSELGLAKSAASFAKRFNL